MPDSLPPASLEQALVNANETIGKLTRRIEELDQEVSDMETVAKRQRRNSRQNENSLRNELSVAQNRRG